MTTMHLATFPATPVGGKFIDGAKGVAAGMAIGGLVNAGVKAYQNYQAKLNYQVPQGFIKVPELQSPAMDNVIGEMATSPSSVETVNASVPSATAANKSVPTVDPNFTPDYSSTSPSSAPPSSFSSSGEVMNATAGDLIQRGFEQRALAIRATNDVVALGNSYVQSLPVCRGPCAGVTSAVGTFTSVVEATYTGNYSGVVVDSAISGSLGAYNNTLGAAYSAGSHLNSMGNR